MTRNVKQYLDALRALLVARLAGPLPEEDELRYAERLEYYWRLLSEAEQESARRLEREGEELQAESLSDLEDAPVAPLAQHSPRRAA